MSPELAIALLAAVGTILAAVITAVPAFLALQRRTAGAVASEGATTRDAVAEAMTSLGSQLHARIDDVRQDVSQVREDVTRVREWQAGHDAEHLLIGRQPPRGD